MISICSEVDQACQGTETNALYAAQQASRANPPVVLHHEIVRQIFSHLSPRTIVRFERVCRLWRHVALTNPALFRDGLAQGEGMSSRTSAHRARIEALAKRNNGRFTDLAFVCDFACDFAEDMHDLDFICTLLPSCHAENLWIHASPAYTPPFDEAGSASGSPAYDFKVLQRRTTGRVLAAVFRCGNLRSLHIDFTESVLELATVPLISSLAMCTFERLSLEGYPVGKLLRGGLFPKALRAIRTLELDDGVNVDLQELCVILEEVKGTIEQLKATVKTMFSMQGEILLPHLRTLYVKSIFGYSLPDHREAVSLNCPKLSDLSLSGIPQQEFLRRLLTHSLVHLKLEMNIVPRHLTDTIKDWPTLLDRCTSLQVLKIRSNYSLAPLWEALTNGLVQVPLKKLVIGNTDEAFVAGRALCKMLKMRNFASGNGDLPLLSTTDDLAQSSSDGDACREEVSNTLRTHETADRDRKAHFVPIHSLALAAADTKSTSGLTEMASLVANFRLFPSLQGNALGLFDRFLDPPMIERRC